MELISREMAIDMMRVLGGSDKDRLMGIIANLPTIEEVLSDYAEGYKKGYIDGGVTELMSRPKGKWEEYISLRGNMWICPICAEVQADMTNYCPNCGADMRGE